MQLLFYKGTKKENPSSTFWDRVICLISRSRFSHIELAFEQSGEIYRCMSSSFRDHGVREKWIDTSSGRWIMIDIAAKFSNSSAVESTIREQIGKPYDLIGLLGTVIKTSVFSDSEKWFCSEIIAQALGFPDSWSYSPEDLYKLFDK